MTPVNTKRQSIFANRSYGAVDITARDEEKNQTTDKNTEQLMRKKLKWHYMNAYEKYKAGGRKPWKLSVQIIKIFLVTVQVKSVELKLFVNKNVHN